MLTAWFLAVFVLQGEVHPSLAVPIPHDYVMEEALAASSLIALTPLTVGARRRKAVVQRPMTGAIAGIYPAVRLGWDSALAVRRLNRVLARRYWRDLPIAEFTVREAHRTIQQLPLMEALPAIQRILFAQNNGL